MKAKFNQKLTEKRDSLNQVEIKFRVNKTF